MSTDYKYFLPDEILIALGRITVNFAQVEDVIAFYTGALVAPADAPVGDTITANTSFRNLVSLLSSLHRYRVDDEAQQEKLDELLRRALTLEGQRNTVTHSTWSPTPDPTQVMRWKNTAAKGKGLRRQAQRMSVAELNTIADELEQLYADITRFMGESPWINTHATLEISLGPSSP